MPQVTPMSGINFPMWEVELGPQFTPCFTSTKVRMLTCTLPSDVPITQLPIEYRYVIMDAQTSKVLAGSRARGAACV